ncbi:hypothetical protein FACS1894211_01790 [Clostridia bacterium]|nr:hypothetical protein FACS1894211_01790 [Clostridia bacterium]
MKLFKRIYFSAIGFLAVLLFVFTTIDASGRTARGDFSVDTAAGYLERLIGASGNPHSVYDESEHKRVVHEIEKILEDDTNGAGVVLHNKENSRYKKDLPTEIPDKTDSAYSSYDPFDRPAKGDNVYYETADGNPSAATENAKNTATYRGAAESAKYRHENADGTGKRLPTWYEQDAYLYHADVYDADQDKEDTDGDTVSIRWPLRLQNIIVAFPAKINADTAKTVVIQAHYDSVPMGPGAHDDMSSVASMLVVIKDMAAHPEKYELNSNVVFVFTDGEENGLYGASLSRKFQGFEGAIWRGDEAAAAPVADRVGFIANFESRGTSGTDIMFETNSGNAGVVRQYAKINKTIYTNSLANFIYSVMPNGTDFSVYKQGTNTPGVNFANIGGGENYHTANDNLGNALNAGGKRFLSQHGDILLRTVAHFGAMTKDELDGLAAGENLVYFTYLTLMTVYYPIAVAFILGALILGVLLLASLANVKLKAFSFKKTGLGAAAQGLAIAGGVGLMYGAYYVFALLGALFGAVDIHALTRISFSSPFLMICALTLTALFSAIVINIFKRVFKLRANDVVTGTILILGVAAAGLSFALPEVSFLLAWLALLESIVLLLTTVFKEKFKNKFGFSIERLFLPVIPLILCMPLVLPICILAGDALGAYMYPLIMALPLLTLGVITPYFSYLKPAMEKAFAKLPPIQFRQEVVKTAPADKRTQKNAAAAAKAKGRVSVRQEKEYRIVKRPIRYSNAAGFSVLGILLFVVLLVFINTGASFSRNVSGKQGFSFGFYDDAIVYVKTVDKAEDAAGDYWMVKDLDAYRYMVRYAGDYIEDYAWDADKAAYIKYDAFAYDGVESRIKNAPGFTSYSSSPDKNSNTYYVTPVFSGTTYNTVYTLTIDNSGHNLLSVTVRSDNVKASPNNQTIDVSKKETVVLTLKDYAYVTFETVDKKLNVPIEYKERANNANMDALLNNFSKYDDAKGRTIREYKDLKDALVNRCRVHGSIVIDKTIPVTQF